MISNLHNCGCFNKAASNGTPSSLPDNAELQEIIKKMYASNSTNLDEITTIKIPNQVSIGIAICDLSTSCDCLLLARSQLDNANLLHGDSVRYEKQSKSLQSMIFLHKVCTYKIT